jgi:hypothetical protein
MLPCKEIGSVLGVLLKETWAGGLKPLYKELHQHQGASDLEEQLHFKRSVPVVKVSAP